MYGETEAQQTPVATTKCSSLGIHGLNGVNLHEKFLCLDIFLFLLKLSTSRLKCASSTMKSLPENYGFSCAPLLPISIFFF